VWYGGVGLLRHVALVYECMDFEYFRELNCSEELLRRLAALMRSPRYFQKAA